MKCFLILGILLIVSYVDANTIAKRQFDLFDNPFTQGIQKLVTGWQEQASKAGDALKNMFSNIMPGKQKKENEGEQDGLEGRSNDDPENSLDPDDWNERLYGGQDQSQNQKRDQNQNQNQNRNQNQNQNQSQNQNRNQNQNQNQNQNRNQNRNQNQNENQNRNQNENQNQNQNRENGRRRPSYRDDEYGQIQRADWYINADRYRQPNLFGRADRYRQPGRFNPRQRYVYDPYEYNDERY